ncbi:hypothetical protein VPHD51_0139 [Vibrio phage D51]
MVAGRGEKMTKAEIIRVFREITDPYELDVGILFVKPNKQFAARALREDLGRYLIELTELNIEHLVHEIAHVLEWHIHGNSSDHGYQWMQIYEELEEKYVQN